MRVAGWVRAVVQWIDCQRVGGIASSRTPRQRPALTALGIISQPYMCGAFRMAGPSRCPSAAHSTVHRPWGSYQTIDGGDGYQVKRITVKPGGRLSLQYHHHRAEHWVVIQGRAHIVRATLESIAYQVADVLEAMEADSGIKIKELRVDGGAAENDFLMQFQSDVLQALTVRPEILETTALGAGYLAGLAVGFWADQAEVAHQWKAERRFAPEMASEAVDALRSDWRRALERSKGWES